MLSIRVKININTYSEKDLAELRKMRLK